MTSANTHNCQYQPGDLVALPIPYHGYSRILQLHAPNPYASRYENIPNTNYGEYCFKPFVVTLINPVGFVYAAPITSRKPKHEKSDMHGDILPVYNHRHIWSESIAINNMIPVPVMYIEPITIKTLPHFRKYRKTDTLEYDWNKLPLPESIDTEWLTSRAEYLHREVTRNRKPWALSRCPDFSACERFCSLLIEDPECFPDPITRRFIKQTQTKQSTSISNFR